MGKPVHFYHFCNNKKKFCRGQVLTYNIFIKGNKEFMLWIFTVHVLHSVYLLRSGGMVCVCQLTTSISATS